MLGKSILSILARGLLARVLLKHLSSLAADRAYSLEVLDQSKEILSSTDIVTTIWEDKTEDFFRDVFEHLVRLHLLFVFEVRHHYSQLSIP